MIKQFLLKTILRAKYHVGYSKNNHWIRKYFWRFNSARKFADLQAGKATVWSSDWAKAYTSNNFVNFSTHEDAKNFSTNL